MTQHHSVNFLLNTNGGLHDLDCSTVILEKSFLLGLLLEATNKTIWLYWPNESLKDF